MEPLVTDSIPSFLTLLSTLPPQTLQRVGLRLVLSSEAKITSMIPWSSIQTSLDRKKFPKLSELSLNIGESKSVNDVVTDLTPQMPKAFASKMMECVKAEMPQLYKDGILSFG